MKNLFYSLKQQETGLKSMDSIKVWRLLSKTRCFDDFEQVKNKFFIKGKPEQLWNCVIQLSK